MSFRYFLFSVFLFISVILLIGHNLDKPFMGIHDWNGARYGNIARNYLRYGLFAIRFAQIENSGLAKPAEFKYFTHYPPLLPLAISLSYRFLGINERATRLVPLLATAGAILCLFYIGRTIFDWRVGLGASLLALATPMIRYFGKNPVHEPLALFFAFLAFLGAAKILKKKRNGWFLVFLGLGLSLLTNWSGVFLLVALSLILAGGREKKMLFKMWFLGTALVFLYFLHVYLLTGSFWGGGLRDVFFQRTSLGGAASLTPFTPLEFLERVRLWSFSLFTISLLGAAALGVYFLFKRGSLFQKKFMTGVLFYGLGPSLVFSNATFIHNYFIYGLTAFFSLSASFLIFSIVKNKIYAVVFFLVLIIFVWFEKAAFLSALDKSRGDFLAVSIGKNIFSQVPLTETVFIEPFDYGASRLPFLTFYSDRKIVLSPDSGYNWRVKVDESRESFQIQQREK